jgi:hypothetical protein
MDWLRSEDLKEEKVVTASLAILAGRQKWSKLTCRCFRFLKSWLYG